MEFWWAMVAAVLLALRQELQFLWETCDFYISYVCNWSLVDYEPNLISAIKMAQIILLILGVACEQLSIVRKRDSRA